MTVRDFSQLSEMLDSQKAKFKMSTATHQYLVGIGLSINPQNINIQLLNNQFENIRVEYDNGIDYKKILVIPTFEPRIGNGYTIELD